MGDMGNQKNVFISHVHEDDKVLQDLKKLLRRGGYEIRDSSIDSTKPNQAKDPDYIKSEILAPRIQWAGAVIVLISPDTHKSEWVEWEIEYAQKADKRIIGVWVREGQESDLPENLDRYADAVVGWQADRVMDAITGKLNNWYNPDGTERPAREIPRYSCQ
jgi:hypothetical protein